MFPASEGAELLPGENILKNSGLLIPAEVEELLARRRVNEQGAKICRVPPASESLLFF
jgi:hypothetical protein